MAIDLRAIFPQWYQTPIPEHSVVQLVLWNWLLQEVPAPEQLAPMLAQLPGWRRQEVIDYIASYDWTIGACDPNAKVVV